MIAAMNSKVNSDGQGEFDGGDAEGWIRKQYISEREKSYAENWKKELEKMKEEFNDKSGPEKNQPKSTEETKTKENTEKTNKESVNDEKEEKKKVKEVIKEIKNEIKEAEYKEKITNIYKDALGIDEMGELGVKK